MSEETCFFGKTSFRNQEKKFGIKKEDRTRHFYVIGKTGMGKTALLKNMAIQDMRNGNGVGFLDPHGEAAEELLDYVPKNRVDDVVYFNPADFDHPIAFNVMEKVEAEQRHLVASGLMEVFKKIWPDVWSARMEYILNNAILALLEYPGSTLLSVNRILADPEYRKEVVENITDPMVKSFWTHEFERYSERFEVRATAAIQNKIGQFISSPLVRNIIGQKETSIDIRKCMDNQNILILNFSKGKIGEDASRLLGGLAVTKLQLAAMERVNMPESERKNFFLFVDEFQKFATESFIETLSEARKYRLALTLAHQYIAQMRDRVRDAVFGNVGTIVSFRVGAEDAEFLEKEFHPEFEMEDFVDLPKYHVYVKLMVDGVTGRPFSASTLPPIELPEKSYKEEIIKNTREKYATPREKVEEKIAEWSGDFVLKDGGGGSNTKLYDVTCDRCGKDTKVPFKPDPDRNVYCKSCLKKVKGDGDDEDEKEEQKEQSDKEESEEDQQEGEKLTLDELLMKNPSSLRDEKEKNEDKKEKKKKSKKEEIDKDTLKKSLKEALEEKEETEKKKEKKGKKKKEKTKGGEIKPGEKTNL